VPIDLGAIDHRTSSTRFIVVARRVAVRSPSD
jgi:hypothetical protein